MFLMNTIGIVGGVGPYAGLDLFKNILDQTKAQLDQEHLPILLFSLPNIIQDRTKYLLGKSNQNPAVSIAKVISKLHLSGASVVGIPCNTAHVDVIFNQILNESPQDIKLLHLINEVVLFIEKTHPRFKNIGILSTTGTYDSNLYPSFLEKKGFNAIQVSREIQENHIHPAIYDPQYGIKANSSSLSTLARNKAKKHINYGIEYLIQKGAEAIILGCTEIPLVFTEEAVKNIPLINPTKILARALILNSHPDSLLK